MLDTLAIVFNESTTQAVVVFGLGLWVFLYATEKVYNRCKRRAALRRRLRELGHDPMDHGL